MIAPPTTGPKPRPMPETTPQAAKALARALPSGNWCDRMAMEQMNIAPAARPCAKRAPISAGMLGASPHSSEAMPKARTLTENTRRRP